MVTSMLDARNDAGNEGGAYQRVEVITGRQRRRRWTAEEKARIVAESLEADANISDVARRHGVALATPAVERWRENHQLHELLAWNWKAAREAAGQVAA
jgi:transposase-like protein